MPGALKIFVPGSGWVVVPTTGLTRDDADARYTRGVVAHAAALGNQTFTGLTATPVDVTGCSVAFTAEAGRRYKVTGSLFVQATVADGGVRMTIAATAGNAVQISDTNPVRANLPHGLERSVVLSGLSGSVTYRLQLSRTGSGTGNVVNIAAAGYPSFILVEDIGAG